MLLLRDIITNVRQDFHALVIDDEPQIRHFVAQVLQTNDWKVFEAGSAEEAFSLISDNEWHLIFCDVMLGSVDGYAVLKHFREQPSNARFVLMTGNGSAVGALDATAIGAYDYLVKPFGVDDILNIAKIVREQHQIRSDSEKSKPLQVQAVYKSDIPLIGKSPKFVECLKLVGRVAATNLPVLISGESGTGKEIVAQSLHQRSNRANGSFVAVNCGAIPDELIESELFGHSKGSFTGADRERIGLWEEADGGTIFLDEITETSPLFQVKLLRALQQGEIRRVGSNITKKVNVRVIAATNRNIEKEVEAGRFRQDLMYRLNAVTIELPTLRDRIDDIPLLADHFSKQVKEGVSSKVKFSAAALEVLKSYSWQGNIRELENAILHAVSMSEDIVYPEHLPQRINDFVASQNSQNSFENSDLQDLITQSKIAGEFLPLAEMEKKYVQQVLAHTSGNKQAAARILNIDRKTLARIIQRDEIS